jgi:hypothetical protein
VNSQECHLVGVMAEDIHRRRPEPSRLLVWAAFRALSAAMRGQAQMLHHCVMPLEKLSRERARLERADPITRTRYMFTSAHPLL